MLSRFLSLIPASMAFAIIAPASAQEASASAEAAPYPALTVLNAFRDACGEIENQSAASQSLTAAGWTPLTAGNFGGLTAFLDLAREAGGAAVAAEGGTMGEMEVFANSIAGEELHIVLSEVRIDSIRVTGCRLFDLGEMREIPAQSITDWLEREPTKIVDNNHIRVTDWEPGILPGHDSFQLFFIPANSQAKVLLKFDGVALKSDTVGIGE